MITSTFAAYAIIYVNMYIFFLILFQYCEILKKSCGVNPHTQAPTAPTLVIVVMTIVM